MIAELAGWPALVPLVPLLGAVAAAFVASLEAATWLVVAASTLAFALACALPWQGRSGPALLVDALSTHMALLTSFVAMTGAWSSRDHLRAAAARRRQCSALSLALLGAMLLALLADDLVAMWIGIEVATLAVVAAVALSRSEAAIRAGWTCFVLCGVGLALALFGTVVLYLAATPVLGPGLAPLSWSRLAEAAPRCNAPLLDLGFVLLLLGYGTTAGLAPLHAWVAEAQAEAPAPVALLAGLLPGVALVALLRLRAVLGANTDAMAPGPPLMALGLLSLLLAAFSLWRRRDTARLVAATAIGQSGMTAFAFGLGGPAAVFAGMLHLTLATLVRAALVPCVAGAAGLKGGPGSAGIGGLVATHRALGLTLAACLVGMAGVPPFGVFTSIFLIMTETVRRLPLVAVALGLGLAVGAAGLGTRLVEMCLGEPMPDRGPAPGSLVLAPAWLCLAAAALLGLAMPGPVTAWFGEIAERMR